jgi:hypothetical protein
MQCEPTFDYFLNSSQPCRRGRKKELEIYTIAEFSKSNAIILTDCYVLNHWFLALIQALNAIHFCPFLDEIADQFTKGLQPAEITWIVGP